MQEVHIHKLYNILIAKLLLFPNAHQNECCDTVVAMVEIYSRYNGILLAAVLNCLCEHVCFWINEQMT